MNTLSEALKEYLTARQSLGFNIRRASWLLPKFLDFLGRYGEAPFVTVDLALEWAQENANASLHSRAERLRFVRNFAAWRSAEDPRTEIPPRGLLPHRHRRPAPYIYSQDEVDRIVSIASTLRSPKGLRGSTYHTLFGLLAVTGMRLGEVVSLDRDDVDLRGGVLRIERAKFGKSRFVPLHPTTRAALQNYARKRNAVFPVAYSTAFFLSERGRRLTVWCVQDTFANVSRRIGLRPDIGRRFGRGPRLHDLRHRFAVTTLIHWYRSGADVEREMPKLATYLGHANTGNVYWYLQAVPELLHLVTEQSRRIVKGGAR